MGYFTLFRSYPFYFQQDVGGGFEKCSDLTPVVLLAGHMMAPGRVLGQPV